MPQDPNEIAEIEIVIDNFVDGFNRGKVEILMSSISPDYNKDGDTYSTMDYDMRDFFANFQMKLELKDVKVTITDKGATATATFNSQAKSLLVGSSGQKSGKITFRLSDATGQWRITRVDYPQ